MFENNLPIDASARLHHHFRRRIVGQKYRVCSENLIIRNSFLKTFININYFL